MPLGRRYDYRRQPSPGPRVPIERKSRYTLLAKVEHKTADIVGKAITLLLKPFKGRVHSLTTDNGSEFAQHQSIAQQLDADFYFAHPYAS